MYYYDGTAWQKMGRAAFDFWYPNGPDIYFNTGRVAIGTTDPMSNGLNVENYIDGKGAVRGAIQWEQSSLALGLLGVPNPLSLGVPTGNDPVNIGVLGIKPAAGDNGAAVYGWNNDFAANNYAGLFYADGTGGNGNNFGLYSVAQGGLNNYAGYYLGRVAVLGQQGNVAQDSAAALFSSTVTHHAFQNTRAIDGFSAPQPGYGYGVQGYGGYIGVCGNSYAPGHYSWTYGLSGNAYGNAIGGISSSSSVHVGVYGTASGANNNFGGYFEGRVVVEGNSASSSIPDADSTVFKAIVQHNDMVDTKAIAGVSAPLPGYGIGLYGEGGYQGVYGLSNSPGYPSITYGVVGVATGAGGGRVGVFGSAYGGNTNWAGYFNGSTYIDGDLRIGTHSAATGYAVSVNGKIACTEVLVQLPGEWPDYVFKKDYKLMSLKNLEGEIMENGHLPGLPSAQEVETSGIQIGEMQKKVVEKIEELTLYTIEQAKLVQELKREIDSLKTECRELKKSNQTNPVKITAESQVDPKLESTPLIRSEKYLPPKDIKAPASEQTTVNHDQVKPAETKKKTQPAQPAGQEPKR
jgi:hypothetical protein